MADEDGRDTAGLGHARERGSALPDLYDRTRRRVTVGIVDGLDRVKDEDIGIVLLHEGKDVGKGRRRRDAQAGIDDAEPFGPQPDLRRRFLGGHVEDLVPVRQGGGCLQEQRGLAGPGFATEQDHRPGHQSTAQDPIQLTNAHGQPLGGVAGDLREQRSRQADVCPSARPGSLGGLLDRAPGLAASTLASPSRLAMTTGAACRDDSRTAQRITPRWRGTHTRDRL